MLVYSLFTSAPFPSPLPSLPSLLLSHPSPPSLPPTFGKHWEKVGLGAWFAVTSNFTTHPDTVSPYTVAGKVVSEKNKFKMSAKFVQFQIRKKMEQPQNLRFF